MELGLRTGAPGSLGLRLVWLTALRLVVVTVVLAVTTTVYLRGFTFGSFSSMFALVTVGIAYSLAAIYAVMLRLGRRLDVVAVVQLVTDQITWTGIVYISGGPLSGATSLYGLTCLSGAILLGIRGGVIAAAAGATAFLGLCGSMVSGVLLPPYDQPIEAYPRHGTDIGYALFVNLLILGVVTLLASYLAERLRVTGGDLRLATARAGGRAARRPRSPRRGAGTRDPEPARRHRRIDRAAPHRRHALGGGSPPLRDRRARDGPPQRSRRRHARPPRPREPAKAAIDLVAIARDVVILAARSGAAPT